MRILASVNHAPVVVIHIDGSNAYCVAANGTISVENILDLKVNPLMYELGGTLYVAGGGHPQYEHMMIKNQIDPAQQ